MQSKSSVKKYIILILLFAVLIGIFVFSFNDINDIIQVLKNAKYSYIFIALGLLLIYIVGMSLAVIVLLKYKKEKFNLFDAFAIGTSSLFFRGVTPFNAGGDPYQIYAFNQCNIKPSKTTPVILINFAVYQFIITVLSVVALSIYTKELQESLGNVFYVVVIIGFIVNFITLFVLVFAMSKTVAKLVCRFAKWLSTKKIFSKFINEKRLASLDQYFLDMTNTSKEMLKSWPIIIVNLVIKLVSMIAYNAIPFYVFKAIGVDLGYEYFIYTFMLTTFAMTMLIWIPTPGASGGVEFVFTTVFTSLGASGALAVSGMLIWRFVTYYLLLVIGFISYLIFSKRRKKYENRNLY